MFYLSYTIYPFAFCSFTALWFVSDYRATDLSPKIIMPSKKLPQKIFEYRRKSRTPKSPVLYVTLFFVVCLFIYVDIIFQNSALQSVDYLSQMIGHETVEEEENPQTNVQNELPANDIGDILSVLQENKDMEEENETEKQYDPLIPPRNVSREERIAWFRKQIPELEILHSSSFSQQFHSRVINFLNEGCSVLFHIIWFSPAKSFGEREFLTMDTFFKAHPEGCLIIISRSMDSERGYIILKPLIDRGFKVSAITPDLPFLVKDTPAELWLEQIKSGNKDPGDIPLSQNLSNLARLAMLYKYGGGYMDTDVIVLRDFSELRNAIGAQSEDSATKQWNRLNNAILIFDRNHPVLWDFMQEFASTFNGNKWGYNGPYLVSRVIGRVRNTQGYHITILPPKAFYPVDWVGIGKLYKKPENELELSWVEKQLNYLYEGDTYGVHLWNKRSKNLDIEEGSVMARLISDHCVVCDSKTTS